MDKFMQAAIEEAKQGLAEGGIPIGSVLVIDGDRGPRAQPARAAGQRHPARRNGLPGERRPAQAKDYQRAVLYSTLSPCDMCSGTALLYKIPKVVIGENRTFQGPEAYVRSRGVELVILDDPECIRLMEEFIAANPELWNEDIGE